MQHNAYNHRIKDENEHEHKDDAVKKKQHWQRKLLNEY